MFVCLGVIYYKHLFIRIKIFFIRDLVLAPFVTSCHRNARLLLRFRIIYLFHPHCPVSFHL